MVTKGKSGGIWLAVMAAMMAGCYSFPNRAGKSPEQAELEKANAMVAKTHVNMTFAEISRIIPLDEHCETGIYEHGGTFYDVPVGRYYYIQLRFQHSRKEKGDGNRLLNLPPLVVGPSCQFW
jgi:hypothetical protein